MKPISAEELKKLCETRQAVIVDIREPSEYEREHIENSNCMPMSQFNLENLKSLGKDRPIVFHCQSGGRTLGLEEHVKDLETEVYILEGGLNSWKRCGGKTIINKKAPLPIMRQVQIFAGALVVLGVILSYIFSYFFSLISLFVGAGLMFSGITGTCGMATLLMKLPYNKHS